MTATGTGESAQVAFEHAGFRGTRAPDLSAEALAAVIDHVEALPFGSDEFTRKRRRYQEIGRVRAAGGDLAVKRWRRPLGLPLRSPALRAAACWRLLHDSGAPTPRLVAALDLVPGTRAHATAMMVTRWLPDHRPLNLHCAGHRPYERRLRATLPALARLLASMHSGGAGHADLRLENIMAIEAEEGRLEDLVLVDVDEVRPLPASDLPGAARDLGNLVFHLRRIDIPDHTSQRILIHYARERSFDVSQRDELTRRAFASATFRLRLRRARRITNWFPKPRARATGAATQETLHDFYGVDADLESAVE